MKRTFSLLLLLALAAACRKNEDPALQQARQVHMEAHEQMEGLEPQMAAADSLWNLLQDAKKTTRDTTAYATAQVGLRQSLLAFNQWKENIVGVPGLEEDEHAGHDHGHQHNHSHEKAPDLTPQQLLAVQQEMKASLDKIQNYYLTTRRQAETLLAVRK